MQQAVYVHPTTKKVLNQRAAHAAKVAKFNANAAEARRGHTNTSSWALVFSPAKTRKIGRSRSRSASKRPRTKTARRRSRSGSANKK